ncbi:glycosyltransferase family 4 protein [Streptococcus suis]
MEKKIGNVLFLTNVPSPYRVRFFDELGKHCNLTVLYQKKASSERNEKWVEKEEGHYRSVFLTGISTGVDNAFCPSVVRYLNKTFDHIIICGISSPTEIFAILWCQFRGIPYYIEGDGAFVNDENTIKGKLLSILKKALIKPSIINFSTCIEHDKYYLCYGSHKSRIARYRFSSISSNEILKNPIDLTSKQNLRNKLGVTEKKIVLYVGQFIPRKGLDILLHAATHFKNQSVGFYLIGSDVPREYLLLKAELGLDNVYFESFKTKDELKEYYLMSDVFVLPTREDIWGLVVNEAMANGLPVVTTDRCNAGLELIKDGKNGYIVSVENSTSLAKAIKHILASEGMGFAALEVIRDYTIETMVEDHIRILKKHEEKINGDECI